MVGGWQADGLLVHRVVGKARELFAVYIGGDREAIPADLMEPVFRTVIRHSSDGHEMEQLMQLYPDVPSPVQTTILGALPAAPDAGQITRALEFVMSDKVRGQDLIYAFRKSTLHPDVLWQWMKEKFDELYTRYEDSPSLLHHALRGVLRRVMTEKELKEAEQFFAGKDTAKYQVVLNQTVESVRVHIGWLQRDRESVASWLAANVKQRD